MARRTGTKSRGDSSLNQKLFVRKEYTNTVRVFEWKGEFTEDFIKFIEDCLFSINQDKSLNLGFDDNCNIGQILVRDGDELEAFDKKAFEATFIEI